MTTAQFAARIVAIGEAAVNAQHKAVTEAALLTKRNIERQTAIATKGSMGFSNMETRKTRTGSYSKIRKNTSKLTVGFDVKGKRNPVALLVGRGAWGLIEYGSQPHTIVAKLPTIQRKGISRAAYKRATTQRRLDIAFGGVGAFAGAQPLAAPAGRGKPVYRVDHKGTKGKMPFHKGIEMSRQPAARRLRSEVSGAVVDFVRSGRQSFTYIRGEVGSLEAR